MAENCSGEETNNSGDNEKVAGELAECKKRMQKQISQVKEDNRVLEHQQELASRTKCEADRQHEQVLSAERERHAREIDRLEKRARAEE